MATKKRRKKKLRRKAATRRGRPKPFPQWALLSAGLVAGLLVAGLVQLIIARTGDPDSGLRNLVSQSKTAPAAAKKRRADKPAKTAANNRYDFYTILPEIETVLPDIDSYKNINPTENRAERNVSYVIQTGSFSNYKDADRMKAKLALSGMVAHIQKISIEDRGVFHRVRLGPYQQLAELNTISGQLKQLGIPALRLKIKQSAN